MAFLPCEGYCVFEDARIGDRMNKLGRIIRKTAAALALTLMLSTVADMGGMTAYAAMTGTVTCDLLNVRSGASTNDAVVTTLAKGAKVDIVSAENGWYKININGEDGYVSAQYVATEADAAVGKTGTVNVSVLNMRDSASTSSNIIGTLYQGTSMTINESSNGWYKVTTSSGATGYVYAEYVSVGGFQLSTDNGGTSTGNTGTSVTPASGEGVCNADALNVRSDASTSASILCYIVKGTKVSIKGTSGDWYKIETTVGGAKVTGYVHGSYITVGSSDNTSGNSGQTQTPSAGEGVCNTSALNIRKEASTGSATYGLIKQGDKVTIIAKTGDWYQVKAKVNGAEVTGYAHASYITVSTSGSDSSTSSGSASVTPESGTGVCNTEVLNVRKEASTSATILGMIYKDDTVTIMGVSGNWYQVKATVASGEVTGFVHASYIDKKAETNQQQEQTPSAAPTVTEVNETVWATVAVNVRKDSNTSSGIVSTLRKGASVTRTGVLSNGWSRVSFNGGTAYIHSDYLTTTNPNPNGSTDNSQGSSGITGVTGEDIVAFAKQWVGYPYVWGGNNLSTGVDCSGFTQQVYLHFGIQINRIADSQKKNGIMISSVEEAKAGDLFFYGSSSYADHVAIYMGDGNVVHASSPSVGIIISPVRYRNPVAIVRVIY